MVFFFGALLLRWTVVDHRQQKRLWKAGKHEECLSYKESEFAKGFLRKFIVRLTQVDRQHFNVCLG